MKYSTIEVTGDVKIGSGGKTYEGEYVVTPSSAEQVLETAGFTLANDVVVEAIPSEYVDTSDANATANDILSNKTAYVDGAKITGEIPVRYSSDVTVSGADVTLTKGYYGNNITKTIPSGSISNLTLFDDFSQEPNTVHVSVDYTVNGGYMEGGRYIRGNHVITASQLVSGTQNITQNGTTDITNYKYVNVNVPNPSTGSLSITSNNTYDVTNYASAVVNVPNPSTGSISITSNNTYDVTNYASAVVNVPNPSTGTISITSNGTYDVTNYASAYANIPSPSGTRVITENGTYDVTNYASADVNVEGMTVTDIIERTNFPQSITYDGTHKLEPYLFTKVQGLKSFTATKEVAIDSCVFYGATDLESVSMPLCNTNGQSIGDVFRDCTSLSSVNLPKVKLLGQNIFRNCTSLKVLVMQSLTALRDSFAYGAGLQKVDFPVCSSFAASNHFHNCPLEVLVLRYSSVCGLGAINSLSGTPFASDGAGGTLYVPSSLISSYQSATNWSTILGYANNQIKSIESTHTDPTAPIDLTLYYVDGTPIGA